MKKIIIYFVFTLMLFGHNAPYSLDKFKPILNISKLQAPTSHYNPLYSVGYGNFNHYCNKYFYLQDNRYMTFFMCGKKNRSELRVKSEWKVNTKKHLILFARVKLFPLNVKREFTFLQIHADSNLINSINKPLLRIVWMKNFHHRKNHIWAVIRTSADEYEKSYKKIDLGLMPKDFFDVTIIVSNNKLSIKINNKLVVKNFDVSYWKNFYNYFKAGVYLQSNGCAKVLFDKLYIKEN